MMQDTKHLDVDLAQPLPRWVEVPPGAAAAAIIWLHGRPLGRITLPHRGNSVYRRGLARAIVHQFSDQILRQLVRNGLATPGNTSLELDRLLALPPVPAPVTAKVLTVVVCTRGERPDLLERCLAGLVEGDVSPSEVIVVRFGGGESGRAREVFDAAAARGVRMRWIDAGDGDLARARRAGVAAVAKPFVAFVDESIRVDRHWVAAIRVAFQDHPQAAAVVGSVLPGELENESTRLLAEVEDRMAWGERFEFRWWQPESDRPLPREWLNVLRLGSGANMAFRTAAIREALRAGTIVRGDAADASQHLDVWLRLLESGHAVIREPAASGRDACIESNAEAEDRVRATAAGISAALVAAAVRRPSRLWGILLLAQWFLRTSLGDAIRQRGEVRAVSWARLRGHLAGTWQGIVGAVGGRRGREVEVVSEGDGEPVSESEWKDSRRARAGGGRRSSFAGGRVLPVELALDPSQSKDDSPRATRHAGGIEWGRPDSMRTLAWARFEPAVDLLACWHGKVLGTVRAISGGQRLTLAQVRRLVVEQHFPTFLLRHLGVELHPHEFDGTERKDRAGKAVDRARRELLVHLYPPAPMAGRLGPGRPAPDARASIVVPTCDRPDDLRACLRAILAQRVDRPVEVIVVDNRPGSGRTPPIVAEFPGVRLVSEPRQGSAYTRNRGLLACRGSIVVFCDDDIVVPDGWLAAMLAPFDEPNVGVVTGNIVPYSLESESQRLNEATCGLGRGSEPFAVDGNWFYGSPGPVQGWEFGTTANAAVRMDMFRDPAVGLFAESLGPGTPVGAGEDPYFFYRALKAGYRIEYLPDAWVWHKHRTSAKALRRQVYNYAKSAVGYHLMTLFADGDRRARASLLGGLQRYYLRRLVQASLGRADVPPRIVLVEIAGNLAGGFSFLASEGRRRMLARDPAHPPTPRSLPATVSAEGRDEPWALQPKVEQPPATIARIPRRRTRGPGRLPHFLVIGAQKSGTTSLHHNLRKHPSIELVPNFRARVHDWDNRKETGFFDGRGQNYGLRTLDDYRALFNDNGLVQGESCPLYETGEALDRIRGAIPDVRLILICREPVSRLESAFNHLRQWHATAPSLSRWATWDPTVSFEANVQAELDHPTTFGLVRMGMYAESITRVLGRFRPEQLLVLVAEEYRADPQATYDRIFDFLGVQPAIIEHRDVHIREHTTRLSDEQRERMAEFYRPHNHRFFQMIGREVPEWHLRSRSSSRADPHAA
jgi:GT2 family glycosyltransferase